MSYLLAFFAGLMAMAAAMLTASAYIKKLYHRLIPAKIRRERDKKMYDWWSSTIALAPLSIWQINIKKSFQLLQTGKRRAIWSLIVFYSFSFTLFSLLIGDFFSVIAGYLSTFLNIPAHSIDALTPEQYEYSVSKLNTYFYYDVCWLASMIVFCLLFLHQWRIRKDPVIIYPLLIYYTFIAFVVKALTVWVDVLCGLRELSGSYYWPIAVINVLLLVAFYKPISRIKRRGHFAVVLLVILVVNFSLCNHMDLEGELPTYFIDGMVNRYLAYYLINLFFDLIAFGFILHFSRTIDEAASTRLLVWCILIIGICLICSFGSYVAYMYYIYRIQMAIPAFAMNPVYKATGFSEFFEQVATVSSPLLGEYTNYMFAVSSLMPMLFLFFVSVFSLFMNVFKKGSSYLYYRVYNIIGGGHLSESITPFYLIAIFCGVLIFIGTYRTVLTGLLPAAPIEKAITLKGKEPKSIKQPIAEKYLKAAEYHYFRYEYVSAITNYNRAGDFTTLSAQTLFKRGYAEWAIGKYGPARLDFLLCLKGDTSLFYGHLYLARCDAELKLNKEALDNINAYINVVDSDPDAYLFKAIEDYLNDKKGACWDDLENCIRLDPSNGEAYCKRGLLNLNARRPMAACDDWNIAVRLGYQDAQKLLDRYCR